MFDQGVSVLPLMCILPTYVCFLQEPTHRQGDGGWQFPIFNCYGSCCLVAWGGQEGCRHKYSLMSINLITVWYKQGLSNDVRAPPPSLPTVTLTFRTRHLHFLKKSLDKLKDIFEAEEEGEGGVGGLMIAKNITSPVSFQESIWLLKGATFHFLNYVIVFPWELNVPGATGFAIFRCLSYLQCSNQRKYIPFRKSALMLMMLLHTELKENVCVSKVIDIEVGRLLICCYTITMAL